MVWAHLWCAPARARSFCFHLWQWRVHFTNIREHDELSFVLVAQSTLESWFSISTNATNGDQIHAEMWSFKHKREIGGGFGLFSPSHSHSCCWCWFVFVFCCILRPTGQQLKQTTKHVHGISISYIISTNLVAFAHNTKWRQRPFIDQRYIKWSTRKTSPRHTPSIFIMINAQTMCEKMNYKTATTTNGELTLISEIPTETVNICVRNVWHSARLAELDLDFVPYVYTVAPSLNTITTRLPFWHCFRSHTTHSRSIIVTDRIHAYSLHT